MIAVGVVLFIVVYHFVKPKEDKMCLKLLARFRKKKNVDIIKIKKFEYPHLKDCLNYKRRKERRKK